MKSAPCLLLGVTLALVGCESEKKNPLVGDAAEAEAPTPTGTSVLGQEAPDPMGNPKTTKKHIEDQHCLANCATILKTCTATADGAEGQKRCEDQKAKCDAECQ